MSDLANDPELRRLAERRVDAKAGFWIHAAIYVVVNAGMALGNLGVTPSGPWFLWSAGCWGIAPHRPGRCGVRADPRFKELLRELKIADYFRASGNWGDFCKPTSGDDFECH